MVAISVLGIDKYESLHYNVTNGEVFNNTRNYITDREYY